MKYLVFGMAAVMVSLSIYQCYLAVTIVLMILLSLQKLVRRNGEVKAFVDGCIGIGMIIAGGVVYYVLMKVVCDLAETPLAEGYYDSVTNLWDNREPMIQRFRYCLQEAVTHFFTKDELIKKTLKRLFQRI